MSLPPAISRRLTQLQRYARYALERRSFQAADPPPDVSPAAIEAARAVRGDRPPAIMLHGITQRAGTSYSSHLINLHPAVNGYPFEMWELPLLPRADDIRRLQRRFFDDYRPNWQRIGHDDFLPLFGAGLVGYLNSQTPPTQRVLVKMPSVQHLDLFPALYPHENLIVLMRDGRDVVASTVRTWRGLPFADACRRWAKSARMILAFQQQHDDRPGTLFIRYESVVADPRAYIEHVCAAFDLDPAAYPWQRIDKVPLQGSSSFKNEAGTARYWVKKPADFNPVGRWQAWSPRQKRIFKRIAGDALVALGYAPDNNW